MRPMPNHGGAHQYLGGHEVENYENPPFHPKGYWNTGMWGPLRRGRIVEAKRAGGIVDQPRRLRFLFNPTEIDVAYTLDPSTQPLPTGLDRSGASLIGQNVGTLSFSLFFDRTFEMWDHRLRESQIYQHGCEVDLNMMKQMLSIEGTVGGGVQEPATYQTFYVFFGGVNSLAYYCWINSLENTYAHFTQEMVPVRASMSVSAALITSAGGSQSQEVLAGYGTYKYAIGSNKKNVVYDPYNSDQLSATQGDANTSNPGLIATAPDPSTPSVGGSGGPR